MNTDFLYLYKAIPLRVIDGDTIDLQIDLGMFIKVVKRIRLFGVNTPEIHGSKATPEGIIAKDYVSSRIMGNPLVVKTFLDEGDKYGRLLAEVFYYQPDGTLKSLNKELLDHNLAAPYMGKLE